MKNRLLVGFLLCLALSGCSSNPSRTHRGDLLNDEVTTRRVEAELSRAGNDFGNVHVSTTGGVVELRGTVASPELRSRAEDLVRNVNRVQGVEDHLQITK